MGDGDGVGLGVGGGVGDGVGASVGVGLGATAAGAPHALASNTMSTKPVARIRGTLILAKRGV